MDEPVGETLKNTIRTKCPIKLLECSPACCFHYNGECVYHAIFTNHKGAWCWVDNRIFCQEGECLGCEVYNSLESRMNFPNIIGNGALERPTDGFLLTEYSGTQ